MSRPGTVKVMLFCVDGTYQRYLAKLLDRQFELCGIVVRYRDDPARGWRTRIKHHARDPAALCRHLAARARLPVYVRRARETFGACFVEELGDAATFPDRSERLRVPDINNAEVVKFVHRHRPDVVCVNGTNLVREPLLSEAAALPLGMINLHSGLSPYTRGGNCNLFALADRRPEWVGMTVHHIDPGIDSGDIILSARSELRVGDNYEDVEYRSFGMGIRMMAEAIRLLATGRAERVPQWQAPGKLYLGRTGYEYSPWKRLQVNRLLERGLIREYLDNKENRDASVRLVGDFAHRVDSAAA